LVAVLGLSVILLIALYKTRPQRHAAHVFVTDSGSLGR
jgi:hypothetical protein